MLENSYPIRTDLALESQERLQEDQADMRGIRVLEERRENGVIVSTVMIETENASVAMGRPKGTYITIEAPETPLPPRATFPSSAPPSPLTALLLILTTSTALSAATSPAPPTSLTSRLRPT